MPIVFVHGVNNRLGPGYEAQRQVTEGYLKQFFANTVIGDKQFGDEVEVSFPYWGGLATSFAWNMASLPRGDMQSLGPALDAEIRGHLATIRDLLGQDAANMDEPLLQVAKRDFRASVELIASLAMMRGTNAPARDIAQFVVEAETYVAQNPKPPWLANVQTDAQLIAKLQQSIARPGDVQSQGLADIGNWLSTVALKLKTAVQELAGTALDRAGDFASTKLLSWTREELNATLGRFFGDIFVYFNGRGEKNAPGPIPQVVLAALRDARSKATGNEPLVVVGHSLGGVITFDLLSYFSPDIEVDLFVSVGSQVAQFEEMKLYRISDKAIVPPKKAPTPANIKGWINVYDEVDIFAYQLKGVFERFDFDARYDTMTYVVKAHGEYFNQRRFYERLLSRVAELP